MRRKFNAPWLPAVIGVFATLLAIDAARELLAVPPHQAQFHLFGFLVERDLAWAAAALHMVFLGWLAYACFTRRAAAVIGIFAYCGYWIVTIWVWSQLYAPGTAGTRLITASMATVVLLVICRVALANRDAFDRDA